MAMFDDSLLDNPGGDHPMVTHLEWLARAGARVRMESAEDIAFVTSSLAAQGAGRPRAVLVVGTEARLVRAVVEPTCPVPVVVWNAVGLPRWVGPLDLVVVLAGESDQWLTMCREASRRGALLFAVVPPDSSIMDHPWSSPVFVARSVDSFVAGIVALEVLSGLGLGPDVDRHGIADALDRVARKCGPRYTLGENPAKGLACALAERVPLVWGASALAARASRRVAEAMREANGMPALAADAQALVPLLASAPSRDVFADPSTDNGVRPGFALVILDDGHEPSDAEELVRLAEIRHQHVETVACVQGAPLERYCALRHHGQFAAAYVGLATRET